MTEESRNWKKNGGLARELSLNTSKDLAVSDRAVLNNQPEGDSFNLGNWQNIYK